MARLGFVIEHPPSHSALFNQVCYSFIKFLSQSQHEIKVLTSRDPKGTWEPYQGNIEVLQASSHWGLWEFPRLLRLLSSLQLDSLHIFQPFHDFELKWSHVLPPLAQTSAVTSSTRIILHFLGCEGLSFGSSALQSLLHSSHMILVSNHLQKQLLQPYVPNATIETVALPLTGPLLMGWLGGGSPSFPTIDSHDLWVKKLWKSWLYLPGSIDQHKDLDQLTAAIQTITRYHRQLGVVFGDGWGKWSTWQRRQFKLQLTRLGLSGQVLVPSDLQPMEKLKLQKEAALILLTTLNPLSFDFSISLQTADFLNRPVILKTSQREADITSSAPRVFCEDSSAQEIAQKVFEVLDVPLETPTPLAPDLRDFTAEPINQLNRIYSHL